MSNYNLPKRNPGAAPDFVKAMPADGTGKLAIFDADGTLWRDDVADDFTNWVIENGHADKSKASWEEYFRIYRENHAAGCRYLLRFYTGLKLEKFHQLIHEWWERHANRNWIEEVLESLYLLAERRYTVWIVTGSPTDTMLPLKKFLPVNDILGMDFETDKNGVITGNHAGISCADEGKAEKILAFWGDKPIAFAAGNGKLDTWMLETSRGVIWSVYPNPEFLEISKERKWCILPRPADFKEEEKLA